MSESLFLDDVLKGLHASPKFLVSKYFYDARGDVLFQKIMRSSEYYPTRAEMNILKNQGSTIADALVTSPSKVDVIGLGAGDAAKSIHLVKQLHIKKRLHAYYPVDISAHIISQLQKKFQRRFPDLSFRGYAGEYFEMLPKVMELNDRKKVILFLGGNMGNFLREQMMATCKRLFNGMRSGDKALIGFDLKKDPRKILAAYNDKAGITAAFNLNLLKRINRELGANFKINQFTHYPTYDPHTGACKSFIISERDQSVTISGTTISFAKGEAIFTEVSLKLDMDELKSTAQQTGFIQQKIFMDNNKYFADVIWQKP